MKIAPLSVAVLMTCHNRVLKTCNCLQALFAQKLDSNVLLKVFLVDDASSDGTSQQVRHKFPQVQMIQGSGNLYWCGGMRLAWSVAAKSDPDFYLLLNDDTNLLPNALESLLASVPSPSTKAIAVGAISDPVTGKKSYGLVPIGRATPSHGISTFNGNCVLISRAVYQDLGSFHSTYTHSMGDHDYGYAAVRKGIPIFETKHFIGTCPRDHTEKTWRDRSLSVSDRLRLLNSPKGLPYREWFVFCRRNYGLFWLIKFLGPTIRIFLGI
jgi:GT2 family glycosyltransferase